MPKTCTQRRRREEGRERKTDRQTETERQRQETEMVTDLESMDLTLRPVVVLSPCLAQKKSSSSICQIELLKHLDISMEILL